MNSQSTPMRMKNRTITALTKIAGLLQRDSGKQVSTDDAAWEAIKMAFPEIADEIAADFGDSEDDEVGNDE